MSEKIWMTGPKCSRKVCGCWQNEGRPCSESDHLPPLHDDCDCILVDAEVVARAKEDGAAGRVNEYNLLKAARYREGLELDGFADRCKVVPMDSAQVAAAKHPLDRTLAIAGTAVQIAEARLDAYVKKLQELLQQIAEMRAKGERPTEEYVLLVAQHAALLVGVTFEANRLRTIIERRMRP